MALIKCYECKKEISSDAKTCPQCGAKKRINYRNVLNALGVIFSIMIIQIILSMFGKNNLSQREREQVAEAERISQLSPEQRKAERDAKNKINERLSLVNEENKVTKLCERSVKDGLHDTGSADMDDHERYYFKRTKSNNFEVQVTGRAKNGFGAIRKITVDCNVKKVSNDNYIVTNIKQIR